MLFNLHLIALGLYGVAAALALLAFARGRRASRPIALAVPSAGAAFHVAGVAQLALVGVAPALSMLALFLVLLQLVSERVFHASAVALFTAPLATGLVGLALLLGLAPGAEPLGGGNAWLVSHITLSVLGLALLALAFIAAALYLLQFRELKSKRFGQVFLFFPPLERLDSLNRSALVAGFPALTAGVLLAVGYAVRFAGGVHVDKAQVVWGLFTWVVVGAAVWLRVVRHWTGRRAAVASIAAFAAVLLVYLALKLSAGGGGGPSDSSEAAGAMSITVIGVNHRTAPLEVRERFVHAPHEVAASLTRVLSAGAEGGVLLSTCNRTEFYLSAAQEAAPGAVTALLADRLATGQAADGYTYTRRDRNAVRHLYRVSAGLDSMILGESQIQGQVREAWELSRAQAGPVLHRLFQSALLVGSRVRSETALGAGTASAPAAAVALAGKIFGSLKGKAALILGAGDTAELAATCLQAEGVQVTGVANRSLGRARGVAERHGASALTLDEAWEQFAVVDIVLCSTAAPHTVVTWNHVAGPIGRRGGRQLCILDLAVPRDVDAAVGQLESVFLYDIDDLQAVAAHGAAQRRAEIPKAEVIVEQEVATFWTWHDGLAVVPVIKEFRSRLDAVRAAELERALKHFGHLSPEDRARIARFSESLLNKFLHEPTRALKAAAESGRGYALLEAVRRLFGFGPDA